MIYVYIIYLNFLYVNRQDDLLGLKPQYIFVIFVCYRFFLQILSRYGILVGRDRNNAEQKCVIFL